MMRPIASVLLLLCAFGLRAEDTVVFEGYPFSRVSSNEEVTKREELNEAQSKEYRVIALDSTGVVRKSFERPELEGIPGIDLYRVVGQD